MFRQMANQGPADAAAIAPAVRFGIDQETGESVRANGLKELRGGGTIE